MPPQVLSLLVFGIQQLITHEPEIAAEIKSLFSKADPTPEDWASLHAKIAAKSYDDYVHPQPVAIVQAPVTEPAKDTTKVVTEVFKSAASQIIPVGSVEPDAGTRSTLPAPVAESQFTPGSKED